MLSVDGGHVPSLHSNLLITLLSTAVRVSHSFVTISTKGLRRPRGVVGVKCFLTRESWRYSKALWQGAAWNSSRGSQREEAATFRTGHGAKRAEDHGTAHSNMKEVTLSLKRENWGAPWEYRRSSVVSFVYAMNKSSLYILCQKLTDRKCVWFRNEFSWQAMEV